MGVYSLNRSSLGSYSPEEIIANENYVGGIGAAQIMIDNAMNDQAMFEAVIANDFAEAYASLNEGAEVSVLTEASLGGAFDKVKAMLKKIWEKIKGLFETFIAKVKNVVIRDNKKYVDAYKKKVLAKNLSKMKYKFCDKKEKGFKDLSDCVYGAVDKAEEACVIFNKGKVTEEALKTKEDEIYDEDALDNILSECISGTSVSSFYKDAHEACFDDEEEREGLSPATLTELMITLVNSDKALKEVNKAKANADKVFSKTLQSIDKAKNNMIKAIPPTKGAVSLSADDTNITVYGGKDRDGKEVKDKRVPFSNSSTKKSVDNNLQLKGLNLIEKSVTISGNAVTMISNALIKETKFEIAQARKVFAKAAAFNEKAVKENALLVEAAGEVAEWEVEEAFENFEM